MSEQTEEGATTTKNKYPSFSEQWRAAPSKPKFIAEMTLGLMLILFIVFLILKALIPSSPEEQATRAAENAIKEAKIREYGHQCLSAWDGSHWEAIRILKENLRDPDSFEHMETSTSRVNDAGNHRLIMRYRAKNGFGGFAISTATGYFCADNCKFVGFS